MSFPQNERGKLIIILLKFLVTDFLYLIFRYEFNKYSDKSEFDK